MCLLKGNENFMVSQLLQQIDKAFGKVPEGDIMIRSLYEIHQRDGESVKKYMLWIHEFHSVPAAAADGQSLWQGV